MVARILLFETHNTEWKKIWKHFWNMVTPPPLACLFNEPMDAGVPTYRMFNNCMLWRVNIKNQLNNALFDCEIHK